MSRLGGSMPNDHAQRNLVRGAGDLIPVTSQQLNVVGVPVDTSISSQLAEFDHILGIAGQTAAQAGSLHMQEVNYAERQNEKSDALYSGLGVRARQSLLADTADQIAQGKIVVPEGQSLTDFATQYVQAYADSAYGNTNPAFKQEILDAAPHLSEQLLRAREHNVEQAKRDGVPILADSLYGAPDAGEMVKRLASGSDALKLTPQQRDSVVLKAMEGAAASGNTDKLDALKAAFPNNPFKSEIDTLTLQAANSAAIRQNKEWAANNDILQKMDDAGDSPSVILAMADDMAKNDQIAPGQKATWTQHLAARESQQRTASVAGMIDQIANARLNGATGEQLAPLVSKLQSIDPSSALTAKNAIDEADQKRLRLQSDAFQKQAEAEIYTKWVNSPLPFANIEDETIQLPDGKTHTVSRDKIIENVTTAKLAQLAQGKTPEQAIVAQVDWAASKGTYPKQMARIVEASPAMAAQVSEGKPVPKSLLDSVRGWEIAKQRAPGWAAGLGDERGRAFLDAAAINLRDQTMSPAMAIQMASKVATSTSEEREAATRAIDPAMVKKAVQALPANVKAASNYPMIEAGIKEQAKVRFLGTNSGSSSLSESVNDAASSLVVLGKWASPTNQAEMTQDLRDKLPDLSTELSRKYVKTNGGNLDSHALVWNPTNGLWEINGPLGVPVTGPGSKFTTKQLAQIADMKTEDAQGTELADIVKTVNAKQDALLEQAMAPDRAIFGGAGNHEQMKADALKRLRDKPYVLFRSNP